MAIQYFLNAGSPVKPPLNWDCCMIPHPPLVVRAICAEWKMSTTSIMSSGKEPFLL